MRIFLISIDTLRYQTAKECGLDELFDKSFDNYYTSCNWTLPSHAALFIGSSDHGLNWDWDFPETSQQSDAILKARKNGLKGVTIAQNLKRQGYNTIGLAGGGFVSKWFGFDKGFNKWEEEEPYQLKKIYKEKIKFPVDSFIFIHDYWVHDYYQDADWPIRQWREVEWRKPRVEVPKEKLEKGLLAYITRTYEIKEWLSNLISRYPNDIFFVTADHGEAFLENPQQIHHGVYTTMEYDEVAKVPLFIKNAYKNLDENKFLADIFLKNLIIGKGNMLNFQTGRYSYRGKIFKFTRRNNDFVAKDIFDCGGFCTI